ncbi:MAG: hypothetical protein AB1499_18590, partial [Nitrospirota bacterium]
MTLKLNIAGLFESEKELLDVVKRRRICYDTEPYYINKKGSLVQIGFQLNLYATFPDAAKGGPDAAEYKRVEHDVMRLAEALSNTCDPMHMCESTTIEAGSITYSHDRGMRPDVTVHIPIFDQKNFGHPVDDNIRKTLLVAEKLMESAG